jgi:hypothetical protein
MLPAVLASTGSLGMYPPQTKVAGRYYVKGSVNLAESRPRSFTKQDIARGIVSTVCSTIAMMTLE